MRIMGIDYGEQRIGVALCDELGIAAHGLVVIRREELARDITRITQLVAEHGVEKLVVGYPVRLDGKEGIQCAKVNAFIEVLSEMIKIPIVKEDETCTTFVAEEALWAMRAKRKKRRAVVDKIAAAVILQNHLERLRRSAQADRA